jgi:hypothetical protein
MMSFLCRNDRCKGGEGEVDTREATKSVSIDSRTTNLNTYGTKLVWNSLRSTFNEPSKRREAVIDETT